MDVCAYCHHLNTAHICVEDPAEGGVIIRCSIADCECVYIEGDVQDAP